MIQQTLISKRVNKVDNVIHIADVHIRNFNRHDEYESVFNRVYGYIKEQISVNANTIIYLAGDIVHAKTDMSPELIVLTRNFFVSLAEIAPVILIAGNHDMTLSNRNRLDALTPIVDSIDTPDFFYLKETGVYTFGGINFVLNAIQDDPENFIKADDLKSDIPTVVLFHGAIDKADIGHGSVIRNDKISIDTFKGFDFGMFGDIHSFQYLDGNARFAYAGSLIQQNFGEGLVHGIIHWNLSDKKSKFVRIHNDWEYHTIDIRDGKIVNLPSEFGAKNRIRVRSYDTANSDLFKNIAKLKSLVKIEDIRIQRFTTKLSNGQTQTNNSDGNVREVEYQNELITSFIEQRFPVSQDMLDRVREINREINGQITQSPLLRNVMWNPVRFEFSNMFSYGEGNVIDFEKMSGTYGIFAQNASGKSSILDSLMFCIFDKCSRTFKASQIINNKKDRFDCKFQFRINNRDYFITRGGAKDSRGNVKVDVNFWYEDGDEIVSLNGKDRDGTNSEIRNLLGTYDDFILTSMSLQGNNTNFIDKAQRERKDLLAQFLDLDLFEELNTLASAEIKSVQGAIKELTKQDFGSKIADVNDALKDVRVRIDDVETERTELERSVLRSGERILELTKQLKPIDSNLMAHNLDEMGERKHVFLQKMTEASKNIETLTHQLKNTEDEITLLEATLNKIDSDDLKKDAETYNTVISEIRTLRNSIENTKLQISHNQTKIDNLASYQYDPNCKYCVNNVFVKDAKTAETLIIDLTEQKTKFERELINNEEILEQVKYVTEILSRKNEIEKSILIKHQELTKLERLLSDNNRQYDEFKSKVERLETLIHSYIENEGVITRNQTLQTEIEQVDAEKKEAQRKLQLSNDLYIQLASQMSVYEKTMSDCADGIKQMKNLEEQASAYEFYIKAVSRNGVPYELIAAAMPKIGAEVNSILGQMVDFQVLFETDGKSINAYIVYDDQNFWPLEMTSGMERFLSSIAIRTALTNVSSLPRPNFIVIDEGWGTLDSNNLNSMSMLFDYIRTQFDFMLTISHIDTMRDIVDSVIEINRVNGYSQVIF